MRVTFKHSFLMCSLGQWVMSLCIHTLLIIPVLFEGVKCSQEGFYSSTARLKELVNVETEIFRAVHDYISSLERRIYLAKLYLQDEFLFEDQKNIKTQHVDQPSSIKSVKMEANHAELVSSDPIRTFQLIRRFVSDLPKIEKDLRNDYERKFLRVFEKVRKGMNLPQQNDLDAATEGILRVQDAYNLDISEFTKGNFEGLEANSSLNAADCYLIGAYSLQATIYSRAIEWVERSYYLVQKEGDTSISLNSVWKLLVEAMSQHNKAWAAPLKKSLYVYQKPVEKKSLGISGKRRARVLDKQSHKLYQTEASFMDLTNFAAICRGEQLQTEKFKSSLMCWYEKDDPQNILVPLKMEILHEDPPILQIHDILSNEIIDEIIGHANPSLTRSKVHGKQLESHKIVSASRTSTSTWISDAKIYAKLSKIYKKLGPTLGVDFEKPGACEDFQVTNYGITGHYNPHQDNLVDVFASGMSTEEIQRGDRLGSLMFFLSDVLKGGFTAFPRLGVAAKPSKGAALFWYNVKGNGEPDPLLLHGGCPILFGQKWIANQWIRANSQMFTRKCGITQH